MARTRTTFYKGDPRAAENGPKAFHASLRNRWKRIGKARWASMTQEEKDYVRMKRDYANAQKVKKMKRLNQELSKTTNFRALPTMGNDQLDDIENFFYGDVI